jgi:hypothetical protein
LDCAGLVRAFPALIRFGFVFSIIWVIKISDLFLRNSTGNLIYSFWRNVAFKTTTKQVFLNLLASETITLLRV